MKYAIMFFCKSFSKFLHVSHYSAPQQLLLVRAEKEEKSV